MASLRIRIWHELSLRVDVHQFKTLISTSIVSIAKQHVDRLQILTELEFSGVDRNKVQSARLLAHLVRCSPELIVSYVQPILDVVLPKLKKSETLTTVVVVSLLTVLGDLVQVTVIAVVVRQPGALSTNHHIITVL